MRPAARCSIPPWPRMRPRVPHWLGRRARRPGRHGVRDELLEHAEIHVLHGFEPDAISGDPGLPEPRSIGLGQVVLVLEAHDVDRYSGRIGAEADLVESSRLPGGIAERFRPIANIRI